MNDRSRQTTLDVPPSRSSLAHPAQFSVDKISTLLAECLEEARQHLPLAVSTASIPLTRDLETDGPFTTVCKLGSGSAATVYLAIDHRADAAEQLVVVKHYLPEVTQIEDFSARFTRELSRAQALNHPGVCKVFDYGRTRSSYYTAAEFLHGEPLSNVLAAPALRSVGNRSPRLVAHLVAKLAEGLHAIHTVGGTLRPAHGDVTSNSLFVLYDGQVRVANFGAGWMREFAVKRAPNDMSYLAPEQLERREFDARADIWSLGVVLWELLAGRRLFHCTTNLEAVVEILARDIPSPCPDNPQVSADLERIVLKALSRDADERYGSAREFSLELEAFIARNGGPVTRTEVVAWLTQLFPNGVDRYLGLVELATSVVAQLPRFTDSFGSAPPVSYASAPASEDEVENTTQIYAPNLDENALRSLDWPPQRLEPPDTVRRPKRKASLAWRAAFSPFAGAFVTVLLGFFAGHETFSRAHSGASPAPAATFELARTHGAPVPAVLALTPAIDARPPPTELAALPPTHSAPAPELDADENVEALHVDFDFDADEAQGTRGIDSQLSVPPSKPSHAAPAPTRPTTESVPSGRASPTATQPGAVYITTTGEVYERGRYLGHSPGEFELSPGWHTLLVKSGNDDRAATVQVAPGSAVVLSLAAGKP